MMLSCPRRGSSPTINPQGGQYTEYMEMDGNTLDSITTFGINQQQNTQLQSHPGTLENVHFLVNSSQTL